MYAIIYREIVKRGWLCYVRGKGGVEICWVDRNMISGLSYGKSSRKRRSFNYYRTKDTG